MVDGSRLPFHENADLVRAASGIAANHGGGIEAELGRVEGDEDASSGADVGLLTDPDQAEQFMVTTGADCLAVSIGNVHGIFRPRRSWTSTGSSTWPAACLSRFRCTAPQAYRRRRCRTRSRPA